MILFGGETITLLHAEDGGYRRYILNGCSWRSGRSRAAADNAAEITLETTCRMPAGKVMPREGDLMIRGEIKAEAENEIELVRLMDRLRREGKGAVRVRRVRDNAGNAPMPHYAVTGA